STDVLYHRPLHDALPIFYHDVAKYQLDTISNQFILQYLSEEEKEVLATQYWIFDVNIPVTVSIMRDTAQQVIPFWIVEAGFQRTDLMVRNSLSTYEVWQKDFDSGRIGLGINGFDKHRPVYFISVGPQQPEADLKINPIFPSHQHFEA